MRRLPLLLVLLASAAAVAPAAAGAAVTPAGPRAPGAPPAAAGAAVTPAGTGVVDRAAQALASDPVYVDPDAKPSLSAAEGDRLRRRIEQGDAGPVYVAVLPGSAVDEAGGDPVE